MSLAGVLARRLQRHGLAAPVSDADPADVVDRMCGAHAQVLSAAELSVGIRLAGATRVDVREALWQDHSLVKTFGPRGTVHLLPAQDLTMWTGALGSLPHDWDKAERDNGWSRARTDETIDAMAEALQTDELTIDELNEAIAPTVPWAAERVEAFQTTWPRWRQIVHLAANQGVLCYGHDKGRKVTYTNPQRWLPDLKPAEGPAALAELVERYLYAYGPATAQNFAQWLARPNPWAAQLFASLAEADRLEPVTLEGVAAWQLPGDEVPEAEPEGLRLLPYFDAYGIGSQPRPAVFPGRASERALAGGQAGNFPLLLIDGVVAGVWHQRRSGRKIHITVEPLADLTPAQRRQLDEQVDRVGEILEGQPELTIGPVTVGPHA